MHKYWTGGLLLMLLGLTNPMVAGSEAWVEKEVTIDKSWTIEFDQTMDEEMLENNNYIGIRDSEGALFPLERTADGNSIRLDPVIFYEEGETYELFISPELQWVTEGTVKTGIVETFRVEYEVSEFEREVLRLTNEERAKHGLAPLELNEELSKVAKEKSRDMHENQYFNHHSPVYGSPFAMMNRFGFDYSAAGENIAAGQVTPEEVVAAWMNSEGHRKNILNSAYDEIGVGYMDSDGEYVTYWTQLFYTPK